MRALAIAAVMSTIMAAPSSAQVVTIATTSQGSLSYGVASAIAKEAGRKSGFRMRVAPMGGPTVTLPQVENGKVDMTIAIAVTPAFARRGEKMFAGRPHKDLRTVAALFPLTAGFMVRADSGIKSVSDLKGKRVTSGLQQQQIVAILSEASLRAYSLSWKDVVGVPAPTGIKGVDDLMAGKVDSVLWSLASGKSKQAHASVGGIRWLPLERTSASEAALKKYAPGARIITLQPSKNLPGVSTPLPVIGAPLVIVANKDTPSAVVTLVVKTLYSKQPALAKAVGAFNNFDPKSIAADVEVPYHEAAIAYFKANGISYPGK